MPAESRGERHVRRSLFRFWVGTCIVLALLPALALPFIEGERFAFLAGVPVVILNLVLLVTALGWLIWYVFAPSEQRRFGRPAGNRNRATDGG